MNPAIIGTRLIAGGAQTNIYAKRQIGERHARKLRAFSDMSAMRR